MAIFVHALEGKPDDPKDFKEKSERDIRVRWLVTDSPDGQVGSGPWIVKEQPDPTRIVLVPSGNKPEPQNIEEVHLPVMPTGNDIAARLLLDYQHPDHVDFAPSLTDPKTFRRLQNDKHVRVLTIPGFSLFYLGYRTDRMNLNLRDAVVRVINVHDYASIGMGAADPAVGPVPPNMNGHDPNLHQKPFDPPQARASLMNSGQKTEAAVTVNLVYTSVSTYAAELADAVARDIKNYLGWTVNLQGVTTWRQLIHEVKFGQPDMFIYSWHQREPHYPGGPHPRKDPYDLLIALFHSTNRRNTNLTLYSNPDVDAYLDGPKPDHLEAQKVILSEVPMVFLSHWKRMAAYNLRVKNLRLKAGALPEDKLVGVDIVQ